MIQDLVKNDDRLVSVHNKHKVLSYLRKYDFIAYDIETKGNRPESAKVIGFAFTGELNNGWYLPIMWWDRETDTLSDIPENKEIALEILQILKTKYLIMHNGVFDVVTTLKDLGVDLTEALYADTILMKHTIDENPPHGLEECVREYEKYLLLEGESTVFKKADVLKNSIKMNGGKISRENYEIWKADLDILSEYAVADAYLTLRLFDLFNEILEEDKRLEFFYDLEVMPLYKEVTIPMKIHGVPIDVDYFEQLEQITEQEINNLKQEFFTFVADDIEPMVVDTIKSSIKITKTGAFAKGGLEYLNIPIPVTKDGKQTVSKAALKKLAENYDCQFVQWLLGNIDKIDEDLEYKIKECVFYKENPDSQPFNIRSNDHIGWLLYDVYKAPVDPDKISKKTGKPSVDAEVLEKNKDIPFVNKLLEIRKEEKMQSTYVKGILKRQLNSMIYPGFLQFGTTSGRYACKDPNFQNLPSNDTRIKKGIRAPKGYKIVNADFASLEPRIFSWITRDPGLLKVWNEGRDLYSYLAINVLAEMDAKELEKRGMSIPPEATDNPADKNYLKKLNSAARDGSKTFTLSVPYGSNAFAMHMKTGWPVHICQMLIDAYLDKVPGLKQYMQNQEEMAYKLGYVETRFGRVRNLPEAKELYDEFGDDIFNKWKMACTFVEDKEDLETIIADYKFIKNKLKFTGNEKDKLKLKKELKDIREYLYSLGFEGVKLYSKFRNMMNNAKNSPIQMTGAHIANAAAIKYARLLKKHKIDGWIMLQIHDEIASIVREDQAEQAKELLELAMRDNWITRQIDVPIFGEGLIADTFDEAK